MTTSTNDERALIRRAGEPARFVELYERYVDRVYAFVSRRTGDPTCRRVCGPGEAEGVEPMPWGFHLYVGDADALYEQALAAGAKSL